MIPDVPMPDMGPIPKMLDCSQSLFNALMVGAVCRVNGKDVNREEFGRKPRTLRYEPEQTHDIEIRSAKINGIETVSAPYTIKAHPARILRHDTLDGGKPQTVISAKRTMPTQTDSWKPFESELVPATLDNRGKV